jgi:arsenate reductase (thioredoxin)
MAEQKIISAFYCSPRSNSISGNLLDSGLAQCETDTIRIEKYFLRDLDIRPCTACGVCDDGSDCPIRDDMKVIYSALERSDAIIFATPVYFYAFPAKAKALIDRCQLFWARKYLLKKPLNRYRKAALIATSASGGEKLFDGLKLTYKYFLDSISIEMPDIFAVRNCQFGPGDIPVKLFFDMNEYCRAFIENVVKNNQGEK